MKYEISFTFEAEKVYMTDFVKHIKSVIETDCQKISEVSNINCAPFRRTVYSFCDIDVIEAAANVEIILTEDEADDVLDALENNADWSIGVSWDTIEFWVLELYGKRRKACQ